MNERNNKKCEILGYSKCTVKETNEDMFRICIVIDSQRENYSGKESLYIFLPYDHELENNLNNYLKSELRKSIYYETTDNIVSGKTKVSKLIF